MCLFVRELQLVAFAFGGFISLVNYEYVVLDGLQLASLSICIPANSFLLTVLSSLQYVFTI